MFSFNAYSFWVWTPKDKKWKNPKSEALASPYLKYKESLKLFDEGDYKNAYKGLKYFIARYPDAKEAAEVQYFIGGCLEKLDKHNDAFLAYQKLIISYPNSQRINEAIERQYNIGEYFLNRDSKKMLGMSVYDFVEQPAIDIFKKIVKTVPFSEYASKAQYKLGVVLSKIGRYDSARDAFQKVIDDYPESEWATPSKYQLALAAAKSFTGADYDSSNLEDATERLDEFINKNPKAEITSDAVEQLKNLRNTEANKIFNIGDFYEKQDKYIAAIKYYRKVVKNYSESSYYKISLQRIDDLEWLLKKKMTREELAKRNKKERKIKLKEELLEKKKKAREEKLQKDRKRKTEKLRIKKEKRQGAKVYKEQKNKRGIESNQGKENLINEKLDKNSGLKDEIKNGDVTKLDKISNKLDVIEQDLYQTKKMKDIQGIHNKKIKIILGEEEKKLALEDKLKQNRKKAEKSKIKQEKIEEKEIKEQNIKNSKIDISEMEQSLKAYNESRVK